MVPRCITIAGSDSGGGAGIQADLKAFAAAGVHGMSAIVALTAQNTREVTAVHEVPPWFVRAQLDAVAGDIGIDAAKTGMLFSRAIMETVADWLEEHPLPLVVDPVMVASSGARLLEDDAVDVLVARLFPLATVVTPNVLEARALTGSDASPAELADALVGLALRLRSSPAGTARNRPTICSTGPSTSRSRSSGATLRPRTAPAARNPRHWRRSSPGGSRSGRGSRRGCRRLSRGRTGPRGDRRRRRPRRRPGSRSAMSVSPGTTLHELRERKPLVHQIRWTAAGA